MAATQFFLREARAGHVSPHDASTSMAAITFTASIVKKDKGSYIARADELSIAVQPATTQRGAIKKLKDAVGQHLRRAAYGGTLSTLLNDAGCLRHVDQFS